MIQARQLIAIMQRYSIPLIVGVFAGLAVANLDDAFYQRLVEYEVFGGGANLFGHHLTTRFFINQVFMVFFFGIAAKEITESVLPGGALNPASKAINPLLGTLGGVLGPAGLYLLLTFVFYGGGDDFSVVANGWAIPTATDIALAWLVARLVFGNGHPAVNFLLLLAVADDAIGLGIIAVFYPDPEHPVNPQWLLLTAMGIAAVFGMRRLRVSYWPWYIIIGGGLSWAGLLKSSIEPALALVVIVPFLPGPHVGPAPALDEGNNGQPLHRPPGGAAISAHHHSPLEQFEHQLKLFVDLGLFFFAFANAGVAFGSINSVTFIVLLSLIVGKMVGVSIFSLIALRLGFPLPTGMDGRHLVVAGMIAGLGLTVALFVASKAFAGPPMSPEAMFLDPAKMGALLSGGVFLLALATGAILRVKDGAGRERD